MVPPYLRRTSPLTVYYHFYNVTVKYPNPSNNASLSPNDSYPVNRVDLFYRVQYTQVTISHALVFTASRRKPILDFTFNYIDAKLTSKKENFWGHVALFPLLLHA